MIGGIEPTKDLLLTALRRGAGVVTANKALLAEHGPQLYEAADAAGADLYFEAAVAGAIPLIRPLRESLAGDRISRIMGIVNGTTNFILSAMVDTGMGYHEALAEATRLGYAEADPTADVDGFDAAAKAAILASIGFHTRVGAADVHREGIAEVSAADIAAAREIGCTVKLLAICERVPGAGSARAGGRRAEGVSARVHPVMLPTSHPLASGGRRLQRGLRRGGGGRPADVLRPRRRRRADRVGGARRPGRGGPQQGRRRPRARGSPPTRRCRSSRWARC